MKQLLILLWIVGGILLVAGVVLMVVDSNDSAQVRGLLMIVFAIFPIMEVRFMKIERRLNRNEGKTAD